MSDRGVGRDHGCRILVGWVLVEALVQTVVVEVPSKFVEDGEGVSLVVDQHSVGAIHRGRCERTARHSSSLAGSGEEA
jgi:hypothetical protein